MDNFAKPQSAHLITSFLSFSTTELPIEPCISHNRINQRFAVQPRTTIANVKLGNEYINLKKSPFLSVINLAMKEWFTYTETQSVHTSWKDFVYWPFFGVLAAPKFFRLQVTPVSLHPCEIPDDENISFLDLILGTGSTEKFTHKDDTVWR